MGFGCASQHSRNRLCLEGIVGRCEKTHNPARPPMSQERQAEVREVLSEIFGEEGL
jgi:hypothetical protein